MNIALFVKEFPPDVIGGTEVQSRRMATALAEHGHSVTVYTKSYGRPDTDDYPFEVKRIPNLRVNPFISTLTFVFLSTLILIKDARKYDVLHCMMIYPNGFVGTLVSLITGIPYFAWIRGGDYYFMKENRVKRWMIRRVLDDALVLTSTQGVIDDVHEEFPDATLRAIPNGVSIPDVRADGERIVFVGRLKQQKGVDRLVRIADRIDAPLLIVGDGPERDSLEELVAQLDVDAEFVGEVSPEEVPSELQRGSIFVLPSVKGEGGTPNAVLEAMAAGLPVVVTDTGGMLAEIQRREIGFRVPADDDDQLQASVKRLWVNEDVRSRMGENARKYVREHHGWATIVDELEDVYADVIEGNAT